MMEIILILAAIAQHHHFTISEVPGWRIVPAISLKPSGPVKLRVSRARPDRGADIQAPSLSQKSPVVPAETYPVQRGSP